MQLKNRISLHRHFNGQNLLENGPRRDYETLFIINDLI